MLTPTRVAQLIDNDKDILKLKFWGIPIWQVCRTNFIALYDAKYNNTDPVNYSNKTSKIKLLLTMIKNSVVNFSNLAKCYDAMFFSDEMENRNLNGVVYDKLLMSLKKTERKRILTIKDPFGFKHDLSVKYDYSPWISKDLFRLLSTLNLIILKYLLRIKPLDKTLDRLEVLNIRYNVSMDWSSVLVFALAAKFVYTAFFFLYKPKIVYIVCAYGVLQQIITLAAKKSGAKVIELQHGIVVGDHFGYNVYANIGRESFPDYFYAFGKAFMPFVSCNYCITENIRVVGSPYLEEVKKNALNNKELANYFKDKRTKCKKIISISEQVPYIKYIVPYVKAAALAMPEWLFIYMPRMKGSFPSELRGMGNITTNNFSTQENLVFSDIHVTVNSTTAIESIFYGVPVVLINEIGLSDLIEKGFLDKYALNSYLVCNTISDFTRIIEKASILDRVCVLNEGGNFYSKQKKDGNNNGNCI